MQKSIVAHYFIPKLKDYKQSFNRTMQHFNNIDYDIYDIPNFFESRNQPRTRSNLP